VVYTKKGKIEEADYAIEGIAAIIYSVYLAVKIQYSIS